MKRKICIVITARPSYSRIKSALRAIQQNEGLELQLVVERSSGGAEIRFKESGEYQDGTFYLTVLNKEYPNAKRKSPKR